MGMPTDGASASSLLPPRPGPPGADHAVTTGLAVLVAVDRPPPDVPHGGPGPRAGDSDLDHRPRRQRAPGPEHDRPGRRIVLGGPYSDAPVIAGPEAMIAAGADEPVGGEVPGRGRIHGVTERQDRKSTRLNSSHLGSSYAVFCLKKKIDAGFENQKQLTKMQLDNQKEI